MEISIRGEHPTQEGVKLSFKEKLLGSQKFGTMDEDTINENGEVSDDDLLEEDDGVPWFRMGMIKKEKLEAKRP